MRMFLTNRFLNKAFEKMLYFQQNAKARDVKHKLNLPESVQIKYGNFNVYGNFSCGEHCIFLDNITIHANSKVQVGRYTVINGPNTDIFASINEVKIGSFCSIARNVSIQEFNHNIKNFTTSFFEKRMIGAATKDQKVSKGNIEIGNDVWIGVQCVILSGAKIGDGSIIAANSVVSGAIPPYAIAGGTPARVIKYRFGKEKIQRLLDSQWWDKINKSNYEEYVTFFGDYTGI